MNIKSLAYAALAVALLSVSALSAEKDNFSATLAGDNEAPPINSAGQANFTMTVQGSTITFSMSFSGLSSNATLSHIHFGQTGVSAGVMIFLCGGGGQPACPAATSGTISGTITAANVVGPTAQGIQPGDLTSALEAVADGISYVNIHTTTFPAGEIRGQVRRGRGRGND
jgi:hypothetical protein